MKKNINIIGIILIAVLLTSCADKVNIKECVDSSEYTYGFWYGVWHGAISQFSFIGSLFSDNIAIYAVNNNGGWYDFGFVGGLGIMVKLFGLIVKGIVGK